jgi:hypothetical protein
MKDEQKAFDGKLDAQLSEEGSEQIALLNARAKRYELKTAIDEVWEDLKTDAIKAWDEVKTAFHDAALKFK